MTTNGDGSVKTASNAYNDAAERLRSKGQAAVKRAHEFLEFCDKRAGELEREGDAMDKYIAAEEAYLNALFDQIAGIGTQRRQLPAPVEQEVVAEVVPE